MVAGWGNCCATTSPLSEASSRQCSEVVRNESKLFLNIVSLPFLCTVQYEHPLKHFKRWRWVIIDYLWSTFLPPSSNASIWSSSCPQDASGPKKVDISSELELLTRADELRVHDKYRRDMRSMNSKESVSKIRDAVSVRVHGLCISLCSESRGQ